MPGAMAIAAPSAWDKMPPRCRGIYAASISTCGIPAAGIPDELQCLLSAWRHRAPSHFDFVADHETFPYFSYQYVLYGMGFRTNLDAARSRYTESASASAQQAFKQLRHIGQQAVADLPTHRALIERIYRDGFAERPPAPAAPPGMVRQRQ